jgi:hypothetical protein
MMKQLPNSNGKDRKAEDAWRELGERPVVILVHIASSRYVRIRGAKYAFNKNENWAQ